MPPALQLRRRFLRRPAAVSAAGFLAGRAVSAVLTLLQLAIVAALFPSKATAPFFVLWTLVWAGSVWLRFGVDQVIPRQAAHARLAGDLDALAGARRVLLRTIPLLAVALPVLAVVLLPEVGAGAAPPVAALCLAAALAWAALVLIAALLRGFDKVGRSGLVQGVVPAAALLAGCALARLAGADWFDLLLASTVALWAALFAGTVIAAASIGSAPLRALFLARGPLDPEQVPAGLLAVLAEVGLALPLLLAPALGLSDAAVTALYAALRVAAVFSWAAGAVAAVATPRLAMAVARRADVGPLLRRATVAAAATSIPLAAIGLVASSQVLGLLGSEFEPYGSVLLILVAGRLFDACTGPLSEALIVGGLVRRELSNLIVFVAVVVAASVTLGPAYGAEGLAAAIAVGTVACSLPRIFQVRRALRSTWDTGERERPEAEPAVAPRIAIDRRAVLAFALVAACAAADLAVTAGWLDAVAGRGLLLAVVGTMLFSLGVAVVEARRRSGGSWQTLAVSPLAAAVFAWGAIYGWRPLSLWLWPRDSTLALDSLGFAPGDLTRAAAIGALACTAWTLGYLGFLGRPRAARVPAVADTRPLTRSAFWFGLALLAAGSLLWGALFVRQGGPAVLLSNPGDLHNDGFASGYAVLGVWIVQGVTLHALAALLRGGGRRAAVLLALGTALSVLASVAMQARGLLFLGLVAAGVVVLCLRTPSRRALAVTIAIAALAIPAAAFLQQVRSDSQHQSAGEAVRLTLRTPPGTFLISDLSVFDNLVALQQLVPGSVDRLDGSSLTGVALAFVPRALWADKPQPVDQRVSAILYPGSAAGSPVGLPGELWWNFGPLAVLLGSLLVGALMGLLARTRRRIQTRAALVLYAVAIASVAAPLTRALAPMATNTALALAGVGLVTAALSPWLASRWSGLVEAARAFVDAAPVRPATGMARFAAIDGLRALAAVAVVVTHVGNGLDAPNVSPLANTWSAVGQPAVMVFFAVSGFVLYRPFLAARAAGAPEPALGQFLVRRLVRALPAYWLLLTLLALLGGEPGVFSDHWWRYYFLAQIYTNDVSIINGGIVPAWTLAIEVTFYVALGALALGLRRLWRPRVASAWRGEIVVFASLLALGTGVWFIGYADLSVAILARSLAGTIGWFAVGMLLAVFSVGSDHGREPPRPLRFLRDHPGVSWLAGGACLVWLGFADRVPTNQQSFHPTLFDQALTTHVGLLAAFLVVAPMMLGARPGGRCVRLLVARPLVWLGVISYGTYLAHDQVITWLVGPLRGIHGAWPRALVMLAIAYGAGVLVGALSWYAIERPLMRAAGKALRRGRRSPAPVGPEAAVRSPA